MNDYIYEFKDLPDTSTPYNAETFTAMQYKLLDSIYPIGSIIIQEESIDRSDFLGFVWEPTLSGVTIVGLDTTQEEFNEIGKTGGEKEHTLTINEMPSHSHIIPSKISAGDVSTATGENASAGGTGSWATTNNTTTASGGGQAHNNLPPYQVVVFWKRIA